jgi:hypothetical protein
MANKLKRKERRHLPEVIAAKKSRTISEEANKPGRIGKLFSGGKRGWLIVGIIALVALGALGAGLKYLEDDARRQSADGSLKNADPTEQTLLNRINPFISPPPPLPTPQLSKEYIYAGGKMLAVEDVNANAAPPADLAVWRPDGNGTGTWYVQGSQGSQQTSVQWGSSSDQPAPGDFDGDGKTDFSVFRPSTGYWYVQKSSDNALLSYLFGMNGDKIAQADYDGDGRTDVAVVRGNNWYINRSSDGGFTGVAFGLGTDTPAAADYDGDGKADIAVWRSSDKTFYILKSSDGSPASAQVGLTSADQPVSADYDGDGKADYAVKSGSSWLILNSSNNQPQTIVWQTATDKAVPNDYDGDGKVDIAVWRESNGTWYIRKSSDGTTRTEAWGMADDIPVPAFYRR